MIKQKFLNNFNIRAYFLRISFFHLSLIFLKLIEHDDLKIISIEAIFYSINIYTYIFFSFLELLIRLTNDFGLNFIFLFNRLSLDNLSYIHLYIDTIIFYFFAYVLCFFYLVFKKIKINLNKKFILIAILPLIILGFFYKSTSASFKIKTHKLIKNNVGDTTYYKVVNTIQSTKFEKAIYEEMRNIYIYFGDDKKNYYVKNVSEIELKGLNYFDKKLNLKSKKNIYIIITESYAFFKEENMNEELIGIFKKNGNKVILDQKGWNKNYTTQGAEYELFCDDYLEKLANDFLQQVKNCNFDVDYINYNKVFIHTYLESFNDRNLHKNLFNKSIFLKDLEDDGFKNDCPWKNDKGMCDHEIINRLMFYNAKNKQNLIFYLSLNTHPPLKPIKDVAYDCNKFLTTSRNKDLCHYFFNLEIFFNSLSNVYKENKTENDILIIYSDTPPLFSSKKNKKYILYDKVPILIIQ